MIGRRKSRIVRKPNLPPFEGIRASTLEGLLAALSQRDVREPIVADLSLGEWRGQELARQCFAQLGIAWPHPLPAPPSDNFSTGWINGAAPDKSIFGDAAADTIGNWVDSEGRGDTAARGALALAEEFIGRLDGQSLILLVLIPRFGVPWQPESAAFLRYLAHATRPMDRLILVGDEQSDVSQHAGTAVLWSDAPATEPRPQPPGLGFLVPGAVDRTTKMKLGTAAGHTLRDGSTLIPMEWRRPPAATPRLEFDRLAASSVEPWLRAFAQIYGNNYFVDPWFLFAEARSRLREGGHGIALQLMERAATCARSASDRAVLQAVAQGFRIALMRYEDAIAAPDPSVALAPVLRGALMMTKGWGMVMTRRAHQAEPYMQAARDLLGPTLHRNRQFLYLLNISALNRLNLGDFDGAMAMEKEIEAKLYEHEIRDYHLCYINSINLARLYRLASDFDLSAAYYDRAFGTTAGARTESDLVYANVCMARLHGACGRFLNAFQAWLRASLHWLSSDVPEAFSWRVLSAILGRKAVPAQIHVEQIAEALSLHLRTAAEAAGIGVMSDTRSTARAPAFVRVDYALADNPATDVLLSAQAIGATGFSVIGTDEVFQSALNGPHWRSLATLVTALAGVAAGAPQLSEYRTILVDDGLGQEMAGCRSELVGACLRLSIGRAHFNDEVWTLSPERRAALLEDSTICVGPAVSHLDNSHTVIFKRYLPPRLLSGEEAELMAKCASKIAFPVLCSEINRASGTAIDLVRALESARALSVTLRLS